MRADPLYQSSSEAIVSDFQTIHVSYNETRADGNFAWPVSYDLTMSEGVVSLLLKIRFTGTPAPANLLAIWESGIETIWNNKVFFADSNRLYEIKIATDFVASGENETVVYHTGTGRFDAGNWYEHSLGWADSYHDETAAHEFGHMMGVFDQYAGGATYGGYTTTGTLMSDLTVAGFEDYYWTIEYYVEQFGNLSLSTQLARVGTGANDELNGTGGNDGFYGLLGDDTIYGLGGNDYLVGQDGNDQLSGGDGDDILLGELGDDTIDAGMGINTIDGGAGSDLLLIDKSRYFYERVATDTGFKLIGTGPAQGESYDIRNVEKFSFRNQTTNVLQDFEPIGGSTLSRNDDGSSSFIDLSNIFLNGLNFYGTTYNGLYVNNNGNVTFGSPLSTYTPGAIGAGSNLHIIAPFWADVDTRLIPATTERPNPPENGQVHWNLDPVHGSFTATWLNVGYYSTQATNYVHKPNSFQLQLIDQGSGDFEIIFRYDTINWTTGNASGGTNGLGGTPARAGFTAGTGIYGQYYELPQSGNQGGMLGLPDTDGNLGGHGVWQFRVSNGAINGIGGSGDDVLTGTLSGDFMDGGGGHDVMRGLGGNDFMYGRDGNDSLEGGSGDDFLDGGDGYDTAFYNAIPAPDGKDGQPAPAPSGLFRRDAVLTRNSDGSVKLADGTDYGVDTLVNIERIQLADGSFVFDVLGSESVLVYRLYQAAFDRTPDEGGFRYWANAVDQWHIQQLDLAHEFRIAPEFIALYGQNNTNRDYTTNMYRNVLQREPDQGGIDYWTGQVDNNIVSRDQLLIEFAQCAENIALTMPNTSVGYWVV